MQYLYAAPTCMPIFLTHSQVCESSISEIQRECGSVHCGCSLLFTLKTLGRVTEEERQIKGGREVDEALLGPGLIV